jgi:hypothetical protein
MAKKKVKDGWILIKTKESDKKKPVKKKKKSVVVKRATEKAAIASRANIAKAHLMQGREASRKSPVRRDLPDDLIDKRIENLLTREFISRVISQYALSTIGDVRKVSNDPKASMIEKIVCKIILQAFDGKDFYRLEWLLQRSIGRVTEKLEVTQATEYANLPMEELKRLHAEKAKKNLEVIRKIEEKEIEVKTIALSLQDYKDITVDGEEPTHVEIIGDVDIRERH